jgi:hypothetical protein
MSAKEYRLMSPGFRANEKFYLPPACRRNGLDRQIDALVYDLYALTPAEIKIVEGVIA